MSSRTMRAKAFTIFTGPVGERDWPVVATERGVQDRGQQSPLGTEQPVHSRQRHVRRLSDRLDGGSRVAVLGEHALGGLDHPQAGGPRLGLAAGVVIAPLDSLGHIADSTTIMEIVKLSRNVKPLKPAVASRSPLPPDRARGSERER